MTRAMRRLIGQLQNTGLEGEQHENNYYNAIAKLQESIHSHIPARDFDTARVAATDTREEFFEGVNHKKSVIFLMSNGCEWAIKSAHGCTMCGHLGKQAIRGEAIPAEHFVRQFNDEFDKIDFKKKPLLNVFNNGSFLNDRELPPEAREEILKKVCKQPDIKMLVLETRPEYVTEEKVKQIKALVPGKHVQLAIGLELKNDHYRTLCLNKGFSLNAYDRAAAIITKYLNLRTYVLLKPPFMTEKEGIDLARETIEHAFAAGSHTVSLEGCTIQDYTLLKELYVENLYSPPWLWSLVELVKNIQPPGNLAVGLFKFFPSPSAVPYNCSRCSDAVLEAIVNYNRTMARSFFLNLDCSCRSGWEKIIREEHPPFETRLADMLTKLNHKFGVTND